MTLAPAFPSVASDAAPLCGDVHVTTTFRPCAPVGSTEVSTSLDALDDTAFLNLLDATITRLIAYRDAYRAAMEEDTDSAAAPLPIPIPTPWYAW